MKLIEVTGQEPEPNEGYYWFLDSLNPNPGVERVERRQGRLTVVGWCIWKDLRKCFTHWYPVPLQVPQLEDKQ